MDRKIISLTAVMFASAGLVACAHDDGTTAAQASAEKSTAETEEVVETCLLYTSPSPRDS